MRTPGTTTTQSCCAARARAACRSRTLGDLAADAIGIIPTPEVRVQRVDAARDRFLILASDGIWEFLSSEYAVEAVGGFLARGEPPTKAARFLIAKAAQAWADDCDGEYRDDITAIVVYLKGLPEGLTSSDPAWR